MIRQYGPGRHRYETIRGRNVPVGTIPVGTLYRARPPQGGRARTYMVDAWLTREYASIDRAAKTSRFTYLGRGGHLAIVRDLSNGRSSQIADHHIQRYLGD